MEGCDFFLRYCCGIPSVEQLKAKSKVLLCYSNGTQPDSEKIRDLILWSSAGDSRLSAAHEYLYNRIHSDLLKGDAIMTSIGFAILLKFIETKNESDYQFSITLTSLIVDCMQISQQPFFSIAIETSISLIRISHMPILAFISRTIISAIIPFYATDAFNDLAIQYLADLLREIPMTIAPMSDIFPLFGDPHSYVIMESIGAVAIPITIASFHQPFFDYLRENQLLGNESYVSEVCVSIVLCLSNECKLIFVHKLIEQLPPLGDDDMRVESVLSSTLHILEKVPVNECISSDSLNLLLIHHLYQASKYRNTEKNQRICKIICSYSTSPKLISSFYNQIWTCLPSPSFLRSISNHPKISAIFESANQCLSSCIDSIGTVLVRKGLKTLMEFSFHVHIDDKFWKMVSNHLLLMINFNSAYKADVADFVSILAHRDHPDHNFIQKNASYILQITGSSTLSEEKRRSLQSYKAGPYAAEEVDLVMGSDGSSISDRSPTSDEDEKHIDFSASLSAVQFKWSSCLSSDSQNTPSTEH